MYDSIVIGSGAAGSVMARRLADAGERVLVLEKRPHIGGNCYDVPDAYGILVHQYGPHIFHTNEEDVFRFLSEFTDWFFFGHEVAANVHGTLLPVPFNLNTLHMVYDAAEADKLEEILIREYGEGSRVPIMRLRENPNPSIRAIADYVYENIFLHYTMKQWGQTPEEIDPDTTARVPVRLSQDDRYFQDAYQGMPLEGYTPMFEKMLDHPNITVELGVDALKRLEPADGALKLDGAVFDGPVIYTGQADELFGFRFGPLPYRTLDFKYDTISRDYFQTHGTVNYTVDEPYTRITEFKHLTGQEKPGVTTIMKEYSRAYTGTEGEIPYYAIISPDNNALYAKYAALAAQYPNLHLLGRLAEYKYYNMDAIAARALALTDELA